MKGIRWFFLMIFLFSTLIFSSQIQLKKVEPKPSQQFKNITVIYPNGGEKWEKGETYRILWSSKGIKRNVKIKLKWGTGHGGWYSIANSTENDGHYDYPVPERIGQTGKQFKVYVMSFDELVKDKSDDFFGIYLPRTIEVLYPNGNEELEQWQEHTIRWVSTGEISRVELLIQKRDGHLTNLTYARTGSITVPNSGSYPWRITRGHRPGKYKICVRTSNKKISDLSDNAFDIILPKINLVCAIGKFGESWKTTNYVIAVKKTKYMNFEVFVTNRGSQIVKYIPVVWRVIKQPGNIVLIQEEAGFSNLYPGKTYQTFIKYQYQKKKAYPFYLENKKTWKKGDYSFEFEIDPLNILGQSEILKNVKFCKIDFRVE